jgi:hypothetical protein
MNRHKKNMKPNSNVVSAPSEPSQGEGGIVRFWVSFLLCLVALGLVSSLMLTGLFLLMGYRVF